ncbi:MAG: L-threonylcarbamoyladenylate synthase [Bacteroidia bacterium]
MIGSDITKAAALLQQGELVAIPTETVYGLAANAFNGNAVAKIYETKGRPQFNPLIIHSNSFDKFLSWGIHIPETAFKLAEKFSPGPLTLVVPKGNSIPDIVTAGHSSVAIRIPNHQICLDLLSQLDFPLAAPSANLSGSISPTSAQHVFEQLGDKIPYILDGGNCHIGLESTIISFTGKTPLLLRLGGLAIEEIEQVLGQALDKSKLLNNENPEAPGMLSRHYAPQTQLRIGNYSDLPESIKKGKIFCIRFSNYITEVPESNQILLSKSGNLQEAAQALFAVMREVDAMKVDLILAEKFPETGLGLAINDRLKRAEIK